ncbi:MAG: hypothetical protein ACXVAM_11535 [Vulcanimicrobiaceae bacterium]
MLVTIGALLPAWIADAKGTLVCAQPNANVAAGEYGLDALQV